MFRGVQKLEHNKQNKIKEYSSPPLTSEGDNGDIAMVKGGFGGVEMHIKAFGSWHLFKASTDTTLNGGWHDLTLSSPWANYGTYEYNPAGYKVTSDGLCHLRGVIRNSAATGAVNTTIATLPKIVRPSWGTSFWIPLDQTIPSSSGSGHRLYVRTSGIINLPHAGTSTTLTWASLDGCYWFVGDKAQTLLE